MVAISEFQPVICAFPPEIWHLVCVFSWSVLQNLIIFKKSCCSGTSETLQYPHITY